MTRLEVRNVTKSYGGNVVLDDVSLAVEPGSVTGLIGPNGAGKTTLFDIVTGLLHADGGHVLLDGRNITRLSPHRRARQGLARTFQRLELFSSLSVFDNVRVAGEIGGLPNSKSAAASLIDLVGLGSVADRNVAEIPTGQARLVELARALMTKPRLLLADEPASGQNDQETVAFGAVLRRLAADGVTILLVEHDMALVMSVCDTIHVLDFGTMIAAGPPAQVASDRRVLDAYLGTGAS